MSKSYKGSRPIAPAAPRAGRRTFLWVGLIALGAFALVIIGFTLLRGGSGGPAAGGTQGPVVEVDQETFDYGDVKVNTPIETIFRVRNAGSETLKIAGDPEVELVEGC